MNLYKLFAVLILCMFSFNYTYASSSEAKVGFKQKFKASAKYQDFKKRTDKGEYLRLIVKPDYSSAKERSSRSGLMRALKKELKVKGLLSKRNSSSLRALFIQLMLSS